MPSFTKPFSSISKADASIAGGKGSSLGEMTQAGIPIPPGFVVLSSAFERFLQEADLNQELDTIFHTVNHEEMRTVELASERVQKLIVEAKMPEDIAREITDEFTKLGAEYVAVRSSATAEDSSSAAWAGQLDTFLNTTQSTLLENVQKCWASLFTPRAIFYRFEKGMHGQKISVAVVVQKMIQSEISGIAFSVHPVTEDRNQLIIEAGFGLGEAIVSGQITPDSYVVEKTPRRIIDTNIATQTRALHRSANGGNEWRDLTDAEGAKPALSTEQTLELAELILTIERHYGFPCDIEWAFEAGSFYITQSRPVTTLSVHSNPVVTASSIDSLPATFRKEKYRHMGFYNNPPFLSWFWSGWYEPDMAHEIGLELSSPMPILFLGGHCCFPERAFSELEALLETKLATGNIDFFEDLQRRLDAEAANLLARIGNCKREAVSSKKALATIVECGRRLVFYWAAGYLCAMSFESILQKKAGEAGLEAGTIGDYIESLPTPLLRRNKELYHLHTLLKKYAANPENVLQIIEHQPELNAAFEEHLSQYAWVGRVMFAGKSLTLTDLAGEVLSVNTQILSHKARDLPAESSLRLYVRAAALLLYVNQAGGEYFAMLGEVSASLLERIAHEAGLSYDEFLRLLPTEIYDRTKFAPDIQEKSRRRSTNEWCTYYEPGEGVKVLEDRDLVHAVGEANIPHPNSEDDTLLLGAVGNRGKVRGVVRVILNAGDSSHMRDGDILVTGMTTPDFTPLMQRSGAIITDGGGLLCHAAIISRELGKPCIIGTKIATQVLKDGDLVEVDADHGVVRVVKRATSSTL